MAAAPVLTSSTPEAEVEATVVLAVVAVAVVPVKETAARALVATETQADTAIVVRQPVRTGKVQMEIAFDRRRAVGHQLDTVTRVALGPSRHSLLRWWLACALSLSLSKCSSGSRRYGRLC